MYVMLALHIDYFISGNWKGNFNYWTAGYQSCKGTWGWCSQSQAQIFTPSLIWDIDQPAYKVDNENCLQMKVLKNGSGIVLNDRNCKDLLVYACKVTEQILKMVGKMY
jgi:hypothetical protein